MGEILGDIYPALKNTVDECAAALVAEEMIARP